MFMQNQRVKLKIKQFQMKSLMKIKQKKNQQLKGGENQLKNLKKGEKGIQKKEEL